MAGKHGCGEQGGAYGEVLFALIMLSGAPPPFRRK